MDELNSATESKNAYCDIIIKETETDFMPCYKSKTATFGLECFDDMEKQKFTQSLQQQRTADTIKTELKLYENNQGYSLMGNLQTKFAANEYFEHTFVFEPYHMASSSFLYGILKIRNGDQLLSLRNEDASLLSHNEVLKLVETLSNNTDENILMSYWRPGTDYVTDIKFNVVVSLDVDELDCRDNILNGLCDVRPKETEIVNVPISEWKQCRTVAIRKSKNSKYLQFSDKKAVFSELSSTNPDRDLRDFPQCHFIEERTLKLHGNGKIRRYKHKKSNNYLFVSEEGFIALDEHKHTTFEMIFESKNAFYVLKECQSERVLCVNQKHENGLFVKLDNTGQIENIGDSFKFIFKSIDKLL